MMNASAIIDTAAAASTVQVYMGDFRYVQLTAIRLGETVRVRGQGTDDCDFWEHTMSFDELERRLRP